MGDRLEGPHEKPLYPPDVLDTDLAWVDAWDGRRRKALDSADAMNPH